MTETTLTRIGQDRPKVACRKAALKVVSIVPAAKLPDGRFLLSKKFVDGLGLFRQRWHDRLVVYAPPGASPSGSLDEIRLLPEELPCEFEILPRNRIAEAVANTGTDPSENPAVALLCLDDLHQLEIARLCSANGVPYVYISEYSLKTRWQIVDATVSNPIKRLRRRFWELGQERKRAKALSGAAGLQANGIPTYDDYKAICPEALLFFDTRVTAGMLATEDQVRRKAVAAGRPLKLMFSGRLVRMKGVMDLIAVAKELRRLHIDFHLSICGAGDLSGRLDQAIRTEDLTRHVTLEGALDFADELVPLSKGSIDLFVCCHPQGDPSCTYLETMSCGVPIVGYANDAFAGLVRYSGAGWLTPLNRPDLLAAEIQRISQTPGAILEMALRSLQFAAEHTFEREFAKRMNQLQTVADRSFPAD